MSANVASNPTNDRIDPILDRVEAGLEEGLLPIDIFNDEEIFKAEMERIFGASWVFVAHESEIPNNGDFVLRRIGLEQVIVSRGGDGVIRIMSNHCRHRGTEVCTAERGNAKHFVCPYHGWSYKNTGEWLSAPRLLESYGGKLDAKEWGLVQVPHVESYLGFIFGNLSHDAKPLKEAMPSALWAMDAVFGLDPRGMVVASPPDRFRARGDWKTAAENFSGDVYHVPHLHGSGEAAGVVVGASQGAPLGQSLELGGGTNLAGVALPRVNPMLKIWGYPPHYIEHFDLDRLDDAQRRMINEFPPVVGTFFPNLSFIRHAAVMEAGQMPSSTTAIRLWQPIAPGVIEVLSWVMVWPFMSEAEVEKALMVGQFTFGSAGVFEQDDTVAWEGIAKAGASSWLRREGMRFNLQQGRVSKVDQSPDPDWTGPGIHRNSPFNEERQLAFYKHWVHVMRGNAGGEG